MAVVDQLNLNVGTEQNPNFVLHDINDKRISTTAVTTATHLLTCNSSVKSIAPITAANLASVLGGVVTLVESDTTLASYTEYGTYRVGSTAVAKTISDIPEVIGGTLVVSPAINSNYVRQEYLSRTNTYVRNVPVAQGASMSNWVKYEGVEMQ
jgi:hypothetical protein